ncbi:MAG TPA: SOS response-associated peptidase family protein [Ignavibacteriaceae bacterium]|nr:SOS response-associated peptidase family protein [Ignavibacteriaceae bacterium]
MCGRFENNLSAIELTDRIKKDFPEFLFREDFLMRRENISPTDNILTVVKTNGDYLFKPMGWGIKFNTDSPLLFNSRIETIKSKDFWLNLYNTNRCIVPMTGFYEWKKEEDKKVPYRIFLEDYDYFFVPALYSSKNGLPFASLITTTTNNFMKTLHHRMPVILLPDKGMNYLTNTLEENLINCIPLDDSIKMRATIVDLKGR